MRKTEHSLSLRLQRVIDVVAEKESPAFVELSRAADLDPAVDFRGANLRGVDLRDEDLTGFDFSGADFTGADLRRANLDKAVFAGAILDQAIGIDLSLAFPPVDFDLQKAYELVLAGQDPPARWRPFIAAMRFHLKVLDVSRLADLKWLREFSIYFDLPPELKRIGSIPESWLKIVFSSNASRFLAIEGAQVLRKSGKSDEALHKNVSRQGSIDRNSESVPGDPLRYTGEITVLTPDRDFVSLPMGATALDFAYHIHTEVGNSATSCIINDRRASLDSQLKDGDVVRIETAVSEPTWQNWLGIVKTSKARRELKRAIETGLHADLGEELIHKEIRKIGLEESLEAIPKDLLQMVCEWFSAPTLRYLFGLVGRNRIEASEVLFLLNRLCLGIGVTTIRGVSRVTKLRFDHRNQAIPGDRIVGIISPDGTARVYPIFSPDLAAFDDRPELWFDLAFDGRTGTDNWFPCSVLLKAESGVEPLVRILKIVDTSGGKICSIVSRLLGQTTREIWLGIAIRDTKHLQSVIEELQRDKAVASANRAVSSEGDS